MNFAQVKAIEQKNIKRILRICPDASEQSGIYIFTREEGGFKFAYVGQAKRLLSRLASHLIGHQYIDLSIKKHGLYSIDNPTGYMVAVYPCDFERLDEYERAYILEMAQKGYQLRNKTSGGQDCGKFGISENKPAKGYYDGLKQGYKKAQKEIAGIFRWLTVQHDPTKKRSEKALSKFNDFIKGV